MYGDCDVLVVGAGPAGSMAALRLSRAGVRVRLLDRASFPRPKLCGDTLNPGSLALLDRVDARLANQIRSRALRTLGMMVTGPRGARVSADYPSPLAGAAITRSELDLLLLEAAVAAGAQFDAGVSVLEPLTSATVRVVGVRATANSHTHTLRARVVIAADGRGSRLASRLGLSRFARAPQRWAYGAYLTGVAGLTAQGEMHIRSDGYIGVAPLPGDLANVCVVRERRELASLPPDEILSRAIANDPLLRERFSRATRASATTVLGPLAIECDAAGCPGLLLAGDAAGFVDPMTGDGLRFALRGGELAADAALRELESGRPAFTQLQTQRKREFAAKWRINRALRALVGSPRALAIAALASRGWHAPVEYLVGVAGDVALVGN